jgi:hypothetical protein
MLERNIKSPTLDVFSCIGDALGVRTSRLVASVEAAHERKGHRTKDQ